MYMEAKIKRLIKFIKESNKIVFFGGAGVSTESGLKDFRSKDGLYYEKYDFPPEEVLSRHFFYNNTSEFYRFYKDKLDVGNLESNITHIVLVKLEKIGKLSSIITQNIDGFHQKAGSKNVLELHGSIFRNHCVKCNKEYSKEYVFNSLDIPLCSCGEIIKPDVILYEEGLDSDIVRCAIDEISKCDLLIIGGTSLSVYPAASFIRYFRGKHMVLINRDSTDYDNYCDLIINKNIGDVFKEIEKEI